MKFNIFKLHDLLDPRNKTFVGVVEAMSAFDARCIWVELNGISLDHLREYIALFPNAT
jgi:hypothetical protein